MGNLSDLIPPAYLPGRERKKCLGGDANPAQRQGREGSFMPSDTVQNFV